MKYTRLGNSGLKVSRLCLGMMSYGAKAERAWHLDEEEAFPLVRRAVDHGITFFDTADMYSNGLTEEITGRILHRCFSHRDNFVLATKVFFPMGAAPTAQGLSRKHMLSAIDASLRRLRTDYIDLYQIHRWDYDSSIEETMQALHDIVRSGKARYVGASSMFAWQFSKAQYIARLNGWTPFVSMQNHYNLVYREEEREMIPLCADQGVGIIPWSPLARGLLAGSRARGGIRSTVRSESDPLADSLYGEGDFDVVDAVESVARRLGVSPAQASLAWLFSKPQITAPILGATKSQHIDEAVAALELRLDAADVAEMESPYRPHAVLGHG